MSVETDDALLLQFDCFEAVDHYLDISADQHRGLEVLGLWLLVIVLLANSRL